MIEVLIVAVLVAGCAFYWIGKLFPAARVWGWRAIGNALRVVHAPQSTQLAVGNRVAAGPNQVGCAGCKGCSTKGGCH